MTHSLTHNFKSRDASASKKLYITYIVLYLLYYIYYIINIVVEVTTNMAECGSRPSEQPQNVNFEPSIGGLNKKDILD